MNTELLAQDISCLLDVHLPANGTGTEREKLRIQLHNKIYHLIASPVPIDPVVPANVEEIKDEFRSIISHALLGCDTSDVPKETWDLVFSECAKFAASRIEPGEVAALKKEIERLKVIIAGIIK